jgi:acetolactate synthase-1/2/3 large subunit
MGAGLPSAIAAKIMNPAENVISICGDGGFMMNSQELETAIRLNLDLTIIVLVDNELGMIKSKQKNKKLSSFGLSFNNPDFVKYAESYGAKGYKLENINDLNKTINKCFNDGGVNLISINIDYSNEN